MPFPSAFCYSHSLRSKYVSQHRILEHAQLILFLNRLTLRRKFLMISLRFTKYHELSHDNFELISFSLDVDKGDFPTERNAF
jgi:hypothetical protein